MQQHLRMIDIEEEDTPQVFIQVEIQQAANQTRYFMAEDVELSRKTLVV